MAAVFADAARAPEAGVCRLESEKPVLAGASALGPGWKRLFRRLRPRGGSRDRFAMAAESVAVVGPGIAIAAVGCWPLGCISTRQPLGAARHFSPPMTSGRLLGGSAAGALLVRRPLNKLSARLRQGKTGLALGIERPIGPPHLAAPGLTRGRPAAGADCCRGSIKPAGQRISPPAVSTIALKRYGLKAFCPTFWGWAAERCAV